MKTWQVIAPGPLTTVQDLGRAGLRHLGVGRGGALDCNAAWLANALLDNATDAAVLELTLRGPTLQLDAPACISLTGAPIQARFEGHAIPMNRPLQIPAGRLVLGGVSAGVRSYIGVAGGFQVPQVLNSRSTDLRGGFGGIHGRSLRQGDLLPVTDLAPPHVQATGWPAWWIDDDTPGHLMQQPIRYIPLASPAAAALAQTPWTASARSDRQGLRLQGPPLAAVTHHGTSEPVAPGTIQLPPDGQPIVLLADAQTVGGYPRLGHVIAADLPRLAQVAPSTPVYFEAVTAAQAFAVACEARARMARIQLALHSRQR